MSPATYRNLRRRLGTQAEAAKKLGVSIRTLQYRESGKIPIPEEAAQAIRALAHPVKKTKTKRKRNKPGPPMDGLMYWER